jgi:double-strand break repair protein MRE11
MYLVVNADFAKEGFYAALDLLQASGLLNYYGRTPESDKINVKPVCLQKGKTKLALYGLSNVRDERLFRTFREGNVKFFRPQLQTGDWFNLMAVHQNHHAYTETGYLPESFLPHFMDLVIWGHEHECKIDPVTNAETGFKVMQPGSSVATSLVASEAVSKHIAIVSITGTDFEVENIRLKTVRPFVWRDIVLQDYPEMQELAHKNENRVQVSQFLEGIVNELIEEAKENWRDAQQGLGAEADEDEDPPLPLVRLRVENTPPEGGKFEIDNPQRFSSRFVDKVANTTDVVQYHRKRKVVRTIKGKPDMPEPSAIEQITLDSVKVDELVKEFLTAQSLTILPQNSFSDAVGQFVDKDDRHAVEEFLSYSLEQQVDSLLRGGKDDDSDSDDHDQLKMAERIENIRLRLEDAHAKGERKRSKAGTKRNPKPANWDSDFEGHWEDSLMALPTHIEERLGADNDEDNVSVASAPRAAPARGRGSRGGRAGKAATGTTRQTAAASKRAPAKPASKSRKRQPFEDDDDDEDEDDNNYNDQDVIMIDDDDDDDDDGQSQSQGLFVSETSTRKTAAPARKAPAQRAPAQPKPAPAAKPAARKSAAKAAPAATRARQTQISFGTQPSATVGRSTGRTAASSSRRVHEPSEDEIDDDDDAFEAPPPNQRARRR